MPFLYEVGEIIWRWIPEVVFVITLVGLAAAGWGLGSLIKWRPMWESLRQHSHSSSPHGRMK